MQKFDFTAKATKAAFVVHAQGRYLKYASGNAGGNDTGLIVTPGGNPGQQILMYPGQAITLASNVRMPDSWNVSCALGQGDISGSVIIGDGRIDDDTLQGVVQVVDGGKQRTLSGNAFAGYGSVGATAGQYARIQLWNPLTNPNRLVVEAVTVLANGGMLAAVLQFNAASLANLQQQGVSKKSGGAASAASINYDTTAAAIGFPGPMIGMAEPNPGTQGFKFSEPVIVLPGAGLVMYSSTLNTTMGASFEWYEEPNV